MTEAQYLALCEKYFAGQCSESEKLLLEQYQQQHGITHTDWDLALMGNQQRVKQLLLNRLEQSMAQPKTRVISISRWMYAAAAILLFFSVSIYLYNTSNDADKASLASNIDTVKFKPGSSKAVLTLANGKTIELDGAGNGVLASGESGAISKSGNGIVIDDNVNASGSAAVALNTITIPRGGKYDITLPDGTKVWLNSASSLTFPIAFKGKERRVSLTGEAYFEVAKNKRMPFKINVNNKQEVEVLGTHFNVNAYTNEAKIVTTLLEGSVKVNYNKSSVLIKPGQMAVNNLGNDVKVQQADLEEIMAWKNDMFIFNNANIVNIMNTVSRWYDVDIDFKGDMQSINFTGNYSRTKGLNSLLKNIELMDKVKFKIEGRRITTIGK